MNVLLIGRDSSLFDSNGGVGDSQARHLLYARKLRERCGADSLLRIVTAGPRDRRVEPLRLADGLSIYPVHHGHRLTYQVAAHRALRTALADWRPDLVSTQTPFQDGLVGLRIARRLGVPLLAQLHFNLFSPAWRREGLLSRLRDPLGRYVLRRADRIRTVSRPLKTALVEHLGIPAERVHTVPVGVTMPSLPAGLTRADAQRRIAPELVGHPVVLFVGRFAPEKNLARWIAVAEGIHRARPQTRFLLAGDGPEREPLERLIRQRGLASVVVTPGALPYDELPVALAASDVFLLTSNHEGFGRVIVEAYLAGLPVVATRCYGPEDLIDDGTSGFLLPRDDVAGLTAATLRLLSDEILARQMADRGQQRMQTQFSLAALVTRLIECWESTAARSTRCVDVMPPSGVGIGVPR